jgi:hypothetical protein
MAEESKDLTYIDGDCRGALGIGVDNIVRVAPADTALGVVILGRGIHLEPARPGAMVLDVSLEVRQDLGGGWVAEVPARYLGAHPLLLPPDLRQCLVATGATEIEAILACQARLFMWLAHQRRDVLGQVAVAAEADKPRHDSASGCPGLAALDLGTAAEDDLCEACQAHLSETRQRVLAGIQATSAAGGKRLLVVDPASVEASDDA